MAHQAGGQRPAPRPAPATPEVQAYLEDYTAFLEAVPFPSLVVDHRWDVVLTNGAFRTLFRGVGPHPTAMPADNFLRFVLFHPDASAVLGEHESSWCLPMLAHFAATLERHGRDPVLQAVRRDIAQDPIMEAAYRQGLPHWIRAVGAEAVEHDGAVRPPAPPRPALGHHRVPDRGRDPEVARGAGLHPVDAGPARAAPDTPPPRPPPPRGDPSAGGPDPSSVSSESRWSGSPSTTSVSQVPQVPSVQECSPSTPTPTARAGGGNAASVRRKDAARPRVSVPVPCAPSPAAAGTPARTGGTARRRTRGRARSAPGP